MRVRLYPTLEDGLKRLIRSVKVVKRKYIDGVASFVQDVALVLDARDSVALRKRVPPPPPYLVDAPALDANASDGEPAAHHAGRGREATPGV